MTMQHSPGFLAICQDALTRVKEISVEETARRLKEGDTVLIDVREESEWNAGHIDGAIHLGKGIIERDIEGRIPDKDASLILYCGGGYRSALAADNLQKMGYTRPLSMTGGWKGWVKARLPTTTRPEVVPRSPYATLGGIVHLPRLIDKCRLYPQGKLPGYNYLTTGFDHALLKFLCVDGKDFETQVAACTKGDKTDDQAMLAWLKQRLGPAWPNDHTIREFNEKLVTRRPDQAGPRRLFEETRAKLPSTKRKVETYFDLIELDEGRTDRLNQ